MTPGTPFTSPLHGILPRHGPTLFYGYVYIYVYFYDPVHLRRHCNHRKHCTSASREFPPSHQVSDASPVIDRSFTGHSFDSRFSIWFDSIVVSVWLDSLVFFDFIWLTSNVFIFSPSHIIRITPHSGFRESHIGQGVFEIFQHWNCGVFHNSDDWNWVWREFWDA